MCIIVYKPRGIALPDASVLRECFDNNSDGAGFMYRLPSGQIHIDKGFMVFRELQTGLAAIPHEIKDLDLALHFRWATQGKVNMANTHPFPISNNPKDLRATRIVAHAGLVHNGMISFCTAKGKAPMSDTQLFVKDVLASIPAKLYRTSAMQTLIQQATGSKFVLMTRDDTVMIGDFIEDEGIHYSNTSYKAYTYCTTSRRGRYTDSYDYLQDLFGWERQYAGRDIALAAGAEDDYSTCDGNCESCRSFSCCDTEEERQYFRDHREEIFDLGEEDIDDDAAAAAAAIVVGIEPPKGLALVAPKKQGAAKARTKGSKQ